MAQKGEKLSEATKQKIRQALLRRKRPLAEKIKISNSLRGIKRSPETRARMSSAQKINKAHVSEETRQKLRKANLGKKYPPETLKKKSLAQKGEKGSNWKGGITPIVLIIRHCFEYRQWVSDIFKRDNFICQKCFKRGGKLNAHHKKYFSVIIQEYKIKSLEDALQCEELWNLNNGETLCFECHKNFHKKNGNS